MAKRILRGCELTTGWSTAAIFLAATCVVGIEPAKAAIDLSASGTVGVQHDDNPLARSNNPHGDTVKRYTVTAAAVNGLVNGPTHLLLQGSYSKVDNEHFNALDHTQYSVSGNFDWKPSQVYDLSLQASQTRAPIPLNDIGGEQVVQQTSSQAEATLRLRPTPNWQLTLTPRWNENKLPLPGSVEDFELREYGGILGLGYLGAGSLIPGVFFGELQGKFSGTANATKYKQQSVGLSLNYKVTDFSSFSLLVGRSRRTIELIEPNSNNPQAASLEGTQPAYTGTLVYQRQLSVKTSLYVSAFRNFQQYDVGVNTTVGTGFAGGVIWNSTPKLTVTLDSNVVWLTIDNSVIGRSVSERKDLARSVSLGAKYLAFKRVSLHPYLTRSIHNSTIRSAVYDNTIAGLELTVAID